MGAEYSNIIAMKCSKDDWVEFLDRLKHISNFVNELEERDYDFPKSIYRQNIEDYDEYKSIGYITGNRGYLYKEEVINEYESIFLLCLNSRGGNMNATLNRVGIKDFAYFYWHDENGDRIIIKKECSENWAYSYDIKTTYEAYVLSILEYIVEMIKDNPKLTIEDIDIQGFINNFKE